MTKSDKNKKVTAKSKKTTDKKSSKSNVKSAALQSVLLASLSENDRLEALLNEAENELNTLQPEIDALEETLAKLQELKQTKQRLLTLKLSIQSILQQGNTVESPNISSGSPAFFQPSFQSSNLNIDKAIQDGRTFYPNQAMNSVEGVFKRQNALNLDLFKAIVFNGGRASTEQIKQYLVEQQVLQPGNQQPFVDVPLTEISARVGYLIKKGLIKGLGNGRFEVLVGWQ